VHATCLPLPFKGEGLEADWCHGRQHSQNCPMTFAAIITPVAAAVAWLLLRRVDKQLAPDIIDLAVVVMVSLAAALTLGDAAF
jgi:hypothetical protein